VAVAVTSWTSAASIVTSVVAAATLRACEGHVTSALTGIADYVAAVFLDVSDTAAFIALLLTTAVGAATVLLTAI
jgi:hypothetical protein